jgi:hypothetical protein
VRHKFSAIFENLKTQTLVGQTGRTAKGFSFAGKKCARLQHSNYLMLLQTPILKRYYQNKPAWGKSNVKTMNFIAHIKKVFESLLFPVQA